MVVSRDVVFDEKSALKFDSTSELTECESSGEFEPEESASTSVDTGNRVHGIHDENEEESSGNEDQTCV